MKHIFIQLLALFTLTCFYFTALNAFPIIIKGVNANGVSRSSALYAVSSPQAIAVTSLTALSYFSTKPELKPVSWIETLQKMSAKVAWEKLNDKYDVKDNMDLNMQVVSTDNMQDILTTNEIAYPLVLLVGLREPISDQIKELCSKATAVTTYDCADDYQTLQKYGKYNLFESGWKRTVRNFIDRYFSTGRKQHKKAYEITQDMWSRKSLEDLVFMVFVLLDTFAEYPIKSVASVTSTESTSLSQVSCMVGNCAKEIAECMKDEKCRKALDCLNSCRGNDQVCSYRCITSHETAAFEKFAYCILQRNNCMNNKASVPVYPSPQQLMTFRGEKLDYETAENIFIGHLQLREGESNPVISRNTANDGKLLPWSWKVICGQNPAYDYFACQHQLFYRDKERPSLLWYDPVFKVTTLYGEEVWRRRHYRVRRGKEPGTFYFSVIDNGVASNEFWKILDCADDLSWAVFHYVGAAAAAGTSYTGSLIVSPDGKWPEMTEATSSRINAALALGEISSWELFEVDNGNCDSSANPPPLGIL